MIIVGNYEIQENDENQEEHVLTEIMERIDILLANVETNIDEDFFSEMCSIFIECHENFEILADIIQCIELQFMNNYRAVKRFNKDENVIHLNEKTERYVNGLISLRETIMTILNEITIMSQQTESSQSSNLWTNVSSINSSAPIIITHYVITTLGAYRQMNVEKLSETFRNWIPGKTKESVEMEVYKMYKSNPFAYWSTLSGTSKWKELAQIALQIISIPPTEAACERVFSARREIMTKHISNIRDPVVEARAHIKSGTYPKLSK